MGDTWDLYHVGLTAQHLPHYQLSASLHITTGGWKYERAAEELIDEQSASRRDQTRTHFLDSNCDF